MAGPRVITAALRSITVGHPPRHGLHKPSHDGVGAGPAMTERGRDERNDPAKCDHLRLRTGWYSPEHGISLAADFRPPPQFAVGGLSAAARPSLADAVLVRLGRRELS